MRGAQACEQVPPPSTAHHDCSCPQLHHDTHDQYQNNSRWLFHNVVFVRNMLAIVLRLYTLLDHAHIQDVRLSLQGYLDLEVLPQEPSPTNSNPEMHLLEECGTPSHVQRH